MHKARKERTQIDGYVVYGEALNGLICGHMGLQTTGEIVGFWDIHFDFILVENLSLLPEAIKEGIKRVATMLTGYTTQPAYRR